MTGLPGIDTPASEATCASCRRSVTPRRGDLGAECPKCGGLLPFARLSTGGNARSAALPSPRAPVRSQKVERLRMKFAKRGAASPELGGLLPLTGPRRSSGPLAPSGPISRADVLAQQAARLIEELAGKVGASQLAEMRIRASHLVDDAREADRIAAERREHGRYWREQLAAMERLR